MSQEFSEASLAQLAEHALRKRMVVGSIPTGGFMMSAATEAGRRCCGIAVEDLAVAAW